MSKIFKSIFVVILTCCALSRAFAGTTVPGMGTNYYFYDLGTYNPTVPSGPGNSWYIPGETVKTPVDLYQLNPSKVDSQLRNMRASGMDYVVLVIEMQNMVPCKTAGTCSDSYPQNWLWGNLLDDSTTTLRPMQQSNLVSVLQDIRNDGFRHVIIRFSDYDMPGWGSTWNESEYDMAWNLIAGVHRTVSQQLAGSLTTPIYDLGMELIGSTKPEAEDLMHRLWSDYTYIFGTSDTVGFSTIPDAHHLADLDWYVTKKPAMYAFDVYGDVGANLTAAWNALGSTEQTKPIIVLETYPNDSLTQTQLQSALAAHPGMNVIAVISWPTGRDVPVCDGCSTVISLNAIQELDSTTQLSNFGAIAAKFEADNSLSTLLSATDVNCGSTSTGPCTIQLHTGFAPQNGENDYQIYVVSPQLGNAQTLMSCGGGGPGNPSVNWIQRNVSYQFQYYRVSTCSDSVSGRTPDATSVVSVR